MGEGCSNLGILNTEISPSVGDIITLSFDCFHSLMLLVLSTELVKKTNQSSYSANQAHIHSLHTLNIGSTLIGIRCSKIKIYL